jgi:hypothetical protein
MKMGVMVWDKLHEIDVNQQSKTVWIAVGEFRGKIIEAKGRSRFSAAGQWRKIADNHKGV